MSRFAKMEKINVKIWKLLCYIINSKFYFFTMFLALKKFFDNIWIFNIIIVIFWRKSEIFANPDSIDVFMRFFHKNSRFKNWWLFFVKMIELRSKNEINKQSWSSFILSFPRISFNQIFVTRFKIFCCQQDSSLAISLFVSSLEFLVV